MSDRNKKSVDVGKEMSKIGKKKKMTYFMDGPLSGSVLGVFRCISS